MLNPNWVEFVRQGKKADIIHELNPQKPDHYHIPERLWKKCLKGKSWLPKVKG
ncbi:hypothetical protein RYD26_10410 [Pasteurellaceae bacterium LIM206]|nr:hypothetical protein [Pasteurellaceae bacterium LIM206]